MRKRIKEHYWWKAAIVLMGTLGLATGFVHIPGFWSGYVLDIVGPAWNYILIRRLFTRERAGMMSRIFTPEVTLAFIVSVCFLVEAAQYLELYDAYFDPYDFVAYISLLLPCYAVDRHLLRRRNMK